MSEPTRSCASPPPADLILGLEQFNHGEFFACHETLETLWLAEGEPLRRLYQGILQVGVALHHLQRANYRGAMNLLTSGTAYLAPFAPHCLGVDVAALLADAGRCRDALAALGPEGIDQFDQQLIPRVRYAR